MNIAELLANETLRHDAFPVTRERIFLGHAGVCPLPRRVAEAMAHVSLNGMSNDQETGLLDDFITTIRDRAAQLLHADAAEIALVGPTSVGLSLVANGLSFRKGDNIVVYFDDYPSNVYPWMALAEKGVQVRFLNTRGLGRIRPLDVLGQVDEQTRLVALASCHFLSGWRLDLEAIGKGLRARNVLFCVDGIQTLGAFPTTVEHVDFLAADAHKWLLGPSGAGILYVRKAVQDRLRPTLLGWHNVRCPDFVTQERLTYRPDARRYEAGTNNLVGLAGLSAALALILEVGLDNIARELLRKRAWLIPALQDKGWTVLNADAPENNQGGIFTLARPDTDIPAVQARLLEENVVTSLRADRSGKRYLRLSPHYYNTDEELRKVVELL
ncbi:MAG: aminotransferase class V-fold PLP-dependent enzyme [Verrucomicrobiota bacterium]